MKTSIIFCLVSICLLASCEKEQQLSLPGQKVYGNWTEVEPQGIAQFEGSTFVSLTLNDDETYRLSYRFWTDIMNPSDPCLGVNEYYSKGIYSITADSIFLKGCYSDATHSGCIGKCDGTTVYEDRYAYDLTPDSLILNPREDVITRRAMIIR